MRILRHIATVLFLFILMKAQSQQKPNVVFIYADDLGYGDLSCYGAKNINTPHIDQLAKEGLRFTNGHSTSATGTPSRYALMIGRYPWRKISSFASAGVLATGVRKKLRGVNTD